MVKARNVYMILEVKWSIFSLYWYDHGGNLRGMGWNKLLKTNRQVDGVTLGKEMSMNKDKEAFCYLQVALCG